MRIECVQEKLQSVFSQAEKISGKNLTLPILSCLLLEAYGNKLTIKSTNLDMGLKISIPVKVEEGGVVAVPASAISAFVANFPQEKNIKLSSDEKVLKIKTQKTETALNCLPHTDFPIIPEVPKTQKFQILATDFVKALRAVWYSASVSSLKPELSSVFVYQENDNLVFAATDSFRLAEKKVKLKSTEEFDRILIPFKNVGEIVRILEHVEGNTEVHVSKHQIAFVMPGVYLVSRVLDGNFPDYQQIIPKEFKTEATILKQDLSQALKVANIFSDQFNQINLKVEPKEKRMELSTKNNNVGQNRTLLDAALTGESVESNFNYRYIADCLQSINSDSVSFLFAGQNRPVVIRGVSDKSFTYLVMPMNR